MADQKPPTSIKVPAVPSKAPVEAMEQLGLADIPAAGGASRKITSFDKETSQGAVAHKFVRTPHVTGFGACRVKSFLGKISVPGMEYMDNNINIWLDQHPDVEIKFVTTTVGPTDGKSNDTSITMNLWY